jgi:hypothetical protein
MTYRLTLTVPDADPIVEEGPVPPGPPAASVKTLVATALARRPAVSWSTLTVELIQE